MGLTCEIVLSVAAREVMLAEYSALADSSVSSFSSLKPVVNPFPDVRYNVFDPKPTMPHHRSDAVIYDLWSLVLHSM